MTGLEAGAGDDDRDTNDDENGDEPDTDTETETHIPRCPSCDERVPSVVAAGAIPTPIKLNREPGTRGDDRRRSADVVTVLECPECGTDMVLAATIARLGTNATTAAIDAGESELTADFDVTFSTAELPDECPD